MYLESYAVETTQELSDVCIFPVVIVLQENGDGILSHQH